MISHIHTVCFGQVPIPSISVSMLLVPLLYSNHVFFFNFFFKSLSPLGDASVWLSIGPSTWAWSTYKGTHPKKEPTLLFPIVPVTKRSSAGARTSCSSSSSVQRFLFGLISHSSCSCCCNSCEFLCPPALLCPENTTSSWSSTASGPTAFVPELLCWPLSLRKRECVPFRAGDSAVSSLHVDQLRVSVNCIYC